jgi:FkbM family methyltransferase
MAHGSSFSKLAGEGLARSVRAITSLLGRRGGTRAAAHASNLLAPVVSVETPRGKLRFRCSSAMAARHAVDFLRHEPETRCWIDEHIRPGEHLWDVGANIGHYSLYAALSPEITVTAFEPVAGTFAALAANVALNGFSGRIAPLCMALSDANGIAPIYLASAEPGMAMHALRMPANQLGPFEADGVQLVPAMRGEDFAKELHVSPPTHVKVDVDGHELAVLQGMGTLLDTVKTLWIEMEDNVADPNSQRDIEVLLAARGFSAAGQGGRNRLFVNRKLA